MFKNKILLVEVNRKRGVQGIYLRSILDTKISFTRGVRYPQFQNQRTNPVIEKNTRGVNGENET